MNRLLPYAGASDCTWFSTARVFGKLYMQCFDQLLACVLRLRLRFSLLLVAIEKGRHREILLAAPPKPPDKDPKLLWDKPRRFVIAMFPTCKKPPKK
jgi:hypothetical protein